MKKRDRGYILFDFDGTICDARKIIFSSFLELLDRFEYTFSKEKAQKLMGHKIKFVLTELGLAQEYGFVKKTFSKILMKKVGKKDLLPCVSLEPLFSLYAQGYRFIIVTNNYTKYVARALKLLGIENLFEEVYSTEDLDMTKIEIFEMVLGTLELQGNKTLYVGDRFTDIRAAKAASIISVAIYNEHSWSNGNELLSEEPDFFISDFSDLKNIVKAV